MKYSLLLFQVFPHPYVTPGLYLVTCQIVINLLHATPDLSSKINTICLVAVISFQTLPSTAAFVVVTNYLFGLKMCNFSKNKKSKKHQQEPQIIHKMSRFSAAFWARRLLAYLLQWHLHILYVTYIVFYATW